MLIEKLVICNIGIFRGLNEFDLRPSPNRPIVLIGGENGAGKTTILESIQWTLFGQLVRTPRREGASRGSYPKYLENLMHRGKDESEDSFVELTLRLRQSKGDVDAVVRRSIVSGSKYSDSLVIVIDGEELPYPNEQWPSLNDAIMPVAISQLYLFDGEQIESLADPVYSSEFLRSGIHALLGVDLIDQLSSDLVVLQRRELSSTISKSQDDKEGARKHLEQLETLVLQAEDSKNDIHDKRAEATTHCDSATAKALEAEAVFRKSGAQLYETHLERAAEIKSLGVQKDEIENRLREFANGCMPLLFLLSSITEYSEWGACARSTEVERLKSQSLIEGLSQLNNWLQKHGCSEKTIDLIQQFSKERIDENEIKDGCLQSYDILSLSRAELLLTSNGIGSEIDKIRTTLSQLEMVEKQVAELETANELALNQEEAEKARGEFESKVKEQARAQANFEMLDVEYSRSQIAFEASTSQLDQFLQAQQLDEHDAAKCVRFGDACSKAKDTLSAFRNSVVTENAHRIEQRIWERFQQLLRKVKLGAGIRIDTSDYTLTIIDDAGIPLPPERLSAGERQLLATSMLWGLADSSLRHLPVVIDTPLGRLDRGHRSNLVREYFPNASSQVILLSTDEEVDERWLPEMENSIARTYTIEFDDDLQCSKVREGYFEMEKSYAS